MYSVHVWAYFCLLRCLCMCMHFTYFCVYAGECVGWFSHRCVSLYMCVWLYVPLCATVTASREYHLRQTLYPYGEVISILICTYPHRLMAAWHSNFTAKTNACCVAPATTAPHLSPSVGGRNGALNYWVVAWLTGGLIHRMSCHIPRATSRGEGE